MCGTCGCKSAETLSKTSCCCGADEANPCACMKAPEPMNCSATEPKCQCYKDLEKNAEFLYYYVLNEKGESPADFNTLEEAQTYVANSSEPLEIYERRSRDDEAYKMDKKMNAEYDEEDMVSCRHCWNVIGNEKEVYGDETVEYEMANGELVCVPCYKEWMEEYKNDLDPHYSPFYAESFEASNRKCGACGETGHNARTCKSKTIPFSTGGFWNEKSFDGLEQLGLPLVDGTHVAMISKIVDGEVLKEPNARAAIPRITWNEEPITMTRGELDEMCKAEDLISIGESTYSCSYLRGALAYLPKNTVLTCYTGYHYPLKATFEYGGEEWIFFLAPRVKNWYAESFEAERKDKPIDNPKINKMINEIFNKFERKFGMETEYDNLDPLSVIFPFAEGSQSNEAKMGKSASMKRIMERKGLISRQLDTEDYRDWGEYRVLTPKGESQIKAFEKEMRRLYRRDDIHVLCKGFNSWDIHGKHWRADYNWRVSVFVDEPIPENVNTKDYGSETQTFESEWVVEAVQQNLNDKDFVNYAYKVLIGGDAKTFEEKSMAIAETMNQNANNDDFTSFVESELFSAEEKESPNQSITTNKIGESLAWNNRIMGMGNQWRNGKYDINSISQEADIIGYTIVHEDYLEKKLDWMGKGVNLGSKDTDIAEINFAGMKIYTGGDGSFPVMGMYEHINDYYARTQNKPHPRGNMTMMEFFDREDYEKAKYEEAKWENEFIEWVRETYEVAPTYFEDGSEMPLYHHVAEKIGQENIPKLLVGARLSLHNPVTPTLNRRDSKSSIWVLQIPDLTHLKTTKYKQNYRGQTEVFINTETTVAKFFSNLKAIYPKGDFREGGHNNRYKQFTINIPSFGEYRWYCHEVMLAYDSVSQDEQRRREGVKRQKSLKQHRLQEKERMKALKEKYGAESFEATEWVGFCPECNKWRTKQMSIKFDSKIYANGWSVPDKLVGKRLCKKSQRFGKIRQSGDTFTGYGSRPFDNSYCGTPLTKVKSKYKAETFEAVVIRQGDVPKGAMAKAMMNKSMMEQANIEAMIQELENKVNLGLISEKDLMESLKKKFGAEYDIEELSKEDLEAYFADLKRDNPKLAKQIEFKVKSEEYLPKKLIESSGYDYEILEAWNDSIIDDDKYALFDPCGACEGEGWILTSYTPATRWDPADGDGEDCGECGGSGKIDPSDYMYYDDKGDIQYEAETKKRKAGIRKCSKCGDYNHNAPNCNRLNEYEEYLKHKDEMLRQCDRAIDEFTRDAKDYSEDGEYGMAKMLRGDATDMKKLKRMIEKNHFGKATHFAMGMDSQPRDLAPSALWLFASEEHNGDY